MRAISIPRCGAACRFGNHLVEVVVVFLLAPALLSAALIAAQRPTTARLPLERGVPTAAQEYFSKGEKLLRQGELDNARTSALEGLKLAPQSVVGYELLGAIHAQQKNYAQAAAAFEKAVHLDPRSAKAHLNLGSSYFAQHKLAEAVQEFRAAFRLDPTSRAARYNLGLVLLAQGHSEQAIAVFQKIERPDASVSLNLMQAYFRAGQISRALELAQATSERAKNDAPVHFSLGVLLAAEKQYAAAIHELETANALVPGTFEILHDLGNAYLRSENPVRAEEVLNRALSLRPAAAETLYLLAQALADQKKSVQALELLVRARKLAPQNTDILFLMGRLSMIQDFFEDAIEVFEEGLKIAPQRADLHAALGESYFTTGKVDRALQEFETLIKLEPSARSYVFMGLSSRHLGRFDEARKYFNQALKKDPRSAASLFNLGYIAHKQGNYTEAEKFLAQALKIDPNYNDALYEMGSVEMAQKKYTEALPLLRRAAQVLPKPAEAYYKLATAERNLHQTEAAQRDLRVFETLSKDPSPGPYPLQHLFDFIGQRAGMSADNKAQIDLEELRREVAQHPDRPRDLYLLVEAYLKLGRNAEALQTVAQLDQLSGGDARTALGVGVLLARFALYPEAIQHFQRSLAADPSSDDAKYDLANAYFRARAYPQALEVMQQVGGQAQQDDAYLGLLGDIYAHLGRTAEAENIFQKAIARNPDNDQYVLSMALTQMRAGALTGAEATLRRGLKRIPDSGRLYWGVGLLAVLHGKSDEAAHEFNRAVDFLPEWQPSYSTLGILYFETGQIAQARDTLERYHRLFPRSALNVKQIQQTLASAPRLEQQSPRAKLLSAEERQQFLQTALVMIDQNF